MAWLHWTSEIIYLNSSCSTKESAGVIIKKTKEPKIFVRWGGSKRIKNSLWVILRLTKYTQKISYKSFKPLQRISVTNTVTRHFYMSDYCYNFSINITFDNLITAVTLRCSKSILIVCTWISILVLFLFFLLLYKHRMIRLKRSDHYFKYGAIFVNLIFKEKKAFNRFYPISVHFLGTLVDFCHCIIV